MDAVFRALADPTRRSLLDELFERDGQSLSSLERRLPMTRFGVMKHLRLLEEAGLVTTRRRGREKLHFLNPVPIRLVHDRWVSKYAEPWAATLSGLKQALEEDTMEKVFEIYIKTTPQRLWEALTDGELRRRYSFGVGIELGLDGRLELCRVDAERLRHRLRREPRGRSAPPPRPELRRAVERRRQAGGNVARHVRDRAGRRLLPAHGHARRAARRRARRAVRRLAADPVRPQDAAGDGRGPDDAGIAHVRRGGRGTAGRRVRGDRLTG